MSTFYFIAGASGSGKTAIMSDLKKILGDSIAVYDFDDIGVPEGADKKWRQKSTQMWLQKLLSEGKDACLLGQIVLGEILACPTAKQMGVVNFCLLDVSDFERIQRLKKRNTYGIDQNMLNWSSWLRMHHQDPQWMQHVLFDDCWSGLDFSVWHQLVSWDNKAFVKILDTSKMTINQVAQSIANWINQNDQKVELMPNIKYKIIGDHEPTQADKEKTDSGKVIVPNGEIYFEKRREGKPLILVHAGFSDRRDWMHQISDFGKEYNTITYDQRGFGNSSVIKTGFSPADDLKALMDHLKIEKTSLVGHSIGGTIALDFSLQYPEKVSALILIASGLNGYSWSKEYLELMNAIWRIPQPEEMTKQFLSAPFYAVSMNEPSIKTSIEMITKENFQKVLTWETFDLRDVHWYFPESISKLKELKVPTLVIYGDKDSEDIKQIAQLLDKSIRKVKTIQIKNTDHLLNFGKSNELNRLIMDFLSELIDLEK